MRVTWGGQGHKLLIYYTYITVIYLKEKVKED